MDLKNLKVGIVILSWNDPQNTYELVESIFQSDYQNFDVIVVDNNSKSENFDKFLSNLKKNNFSYKIISENEIIQGTQDFSKNIFIIRSNEVSEYNFAENLGVSRGYNKGIKFVMSNMYKFLVKLDCDFIISKKLISGLIKTFEGNKNAVAVSPKVYYYINKKTKIIWWKGVNFTKNYFRFQRTGKGASRRVLDEGQFKGIHKSEGICGCCVMLKTEVIKKTGLLDTDFFFGPEDIEHAFRLKKHGELLINLDYHSYHKVSQSIFISGVKKRIYFETIGWLLLIKKICNTKDRIAGYTYFLIRGVSHGIRYFFSKDKDAHLGFVMGIKDFFFKNKP